VIVVGGGPGGSSAAQTLARAGARVLVLEKKTFPRAKTCGDGLTPRAVKVLEQLGMAAKLETYQRVHGLRVIGASNRTLEMQWPSSAEFPNYGLVRPRKDLDLDLADAARAAGAEYMFGTEAVSPLVEDAKVAGVRWVQKLASPGGGVVKIDQGELRSHFVLIADGASSPFGRAMGIARDESYPMGLAIRTYYRSSGDKDDFFESWLELRKGDELLPGYGWIFPVGDGTVNIGVGLLTTFGHWRQVNLNHLQRAFIDMLPASYGISHEDQTEPYKSGRLPMATSAIRPYGPGYLLIGDAAGMVNPFNGEGIAYALETGVLAGRITADALSNGKSPELREYHEAINDIYGAYFRAGKRFTKIIGSPRVFRALCQVGMRSQTMMEFVFLVLANLAPRRGGGLGPSVMRSVLRFAEKDLADLPPLRIPDLPPAKVDKGIENKAGAA